MSSTKWAPPNTPRWTARRKAEVLVALDQGVVTLDKLSAEHGISPEEIEGWRRLYKVDGLRALRSTRLQVYLGKP